MVKTVEVNAVFNKKAKLFTCHQHEFLEKAAEFFQIDMRNIDLYAVRRGVRRKIKPHDIVDLMKIELIPKSSSTENGQKSLHSYFADETGSRNTLIENITTKLKNNTILTGMERKSLVEWLQDYSTENPKKRKMSTESQTVVAHKKVQVNLSRTDVKDSFVQTDFVNIEERVDPDDEPISIKIKKIACNGNANKDEVQKLMQESFDERRHFIMLKNPLVCVVRDKYPLLFSYDEVKNELDRIFYPGKCSDFIKNMTIFSKHILDSCSPTDELYIRTQKSIERAHTDVQKQYARDVGCIFILCSFLDEECRFIHLNDHAGGSSPDIYPHIDASCYSMKEIFFDNFLYGIVVEDQRLCEAPNLLEAVLCLMAGFFIFNIDYPENNRRTLTVFEKLYLRANDSTDVDEMTSQMIKMLQLKLINES